jgi:hypothetical protein
MLPPLYSRWMEALLGATVPDEHEATCSECAMQARPDEPPHPRSVYFTGGKCCTWQPALHSFLVGRVLLDDSPEQARGRAVLEALIDRRTGVSPLGVHGRASYWLLYENNNAAFGRAPSLRCPFYLEEGGHCGMWKHRDSTCSTWFCKHDRGAVGLRFWRALHDLLMDLEYAVVRHCALELDVGDEALAVLFPLPGLQRVLPGEDLEGVVEVPAYRARWGRWHGRERDYFIAAARLVESLPVSELVALTGVQGQVTLRRARANFAHLVDRTPPAEPLQLGRLDLVSSKDGVVRLRTYREFDLIDVPQPLLQALPRFDGRPTDAVLREIEAHHGLSLTPELLRTLVDFEVLAPAQR